MDPPVGATAAKPFRVTFGNRSFTLSYSGNLTVSNQGETLIHRQQLVAFAGGESRETGPAVHAASLTEESPCHLYMPMI